jgi:hypothetical protein
LRRPEYENGKIKEKRNGPEGIEPVHHTAMAGDEVPRIFHAEMPLES